MTQNRPNTTPLVSIIVPTMNEAQNIEPLLTRLGEAMAGVPFEVLFVDDSTDNTPDVVAAVKDRFPFGVRILVRPLERRNGLSGAVVEGFGAVHGEWMCVMDGDLQHPPEVVPQMLAQAQKAGADMVVGSRKANLLGPIGLSRFRSFTSQMLTVMARALFPRSLKDVSDPLTGLFLVRREKVLVERLRPNGFKILLEILVRCPYMRITEVRFDFALRHGGESKADFQEGMRFFRHLLTLRLSSHRRPLAQFLLVALTAFLVNLGVLAGLVEWGEWSYLWAAVIAGEIGILWNFFGKEWFAFDGADDGGSGGRFQHYFGMNQLALLGLRLPLMWVGVEQIGLHYLLANILTIFVTVFVQYMLSDRWIWTRGLLIDNTREVSYYNIHDLLLIESPVLLPDLDAFWVSEVDRPVDIQIRIDRHGIPRQLERSVAHDERIGRLGFGLTVLPSAEYSEVVVSPVVEHAPYVLYTNVVEPLVRWMLAQKGVAFVRAGCVILDGRAKLLVAERPEVIQTAVLDLLEEPNVAYVAHEWVLLTAEGEALAYPKPVTVRRVLDWRVVRQVGALLRRLRFPTVTVNCFVQRVLPPKQGRIQELYPAVERPEQVILREVVPLLRGEKISLDGVLQVLEMSSGDELGFPLFERLCEEMGEVRPLERVLVEQALAGCEIVVFDGSVKKVEGALTRRHGGTEVGV